MDCGCFLLIFDNKAEKEYNESNTLVPLYDNEDAVCGIVYNEVPYYFLKNSQEDIIGIANNTGEIIANYTYDAWGKVTAITGANQTIAEINPFRYRGYYYDTEIGMYYLQSRYYDPMVGRFVNADDCEHIAMGGHICSHNVYCYCHNNIIMNTDSEGQFVISTTVLCVIGGALIGATIGGFIGSSCAKRDKAKKEDTWKYIVGGIGIGAALGAIAGYFAAPAVASMTGVSGISITKAGITTLPLKTGGQGHHVISNKILKAIKQNKSLSGKVNRNKSVVKAWTKEAHRGYQEWHRQIDKTMEKWLLKHQNATLEEFGRQLYNQYNTKDMIKRFGEDVLRYINNVYLK